MKNLLLKTGIITLLFIAIFTGCRDDDAPQSVENISLNKTELTLTEGEEASLEATISPKGVTASLEWSSSNTSVATVDENGKVTAVNAGETVIIVTDKQSKKTAKCNVTVNYKGVAVEKTSVEVVIGFNTEVAITAGAGEYTATVDNANATVEIIDGKVVITGVTEGEAVVTITDTTTNKTTNINVSVITAPELTFDKEKVDWSGDSKGYVKFIIGDTEANRTITITNGTAPYILIQKDCSNYSDHKSTSNVAYNKTVNIKCSSYSTDETEVKAGDIAGNTVTFDAPETIYGEDYIIRDAAGKEKEISIDVVDQLEVSKTTYTVLVGQTINNQSEIKVSGYAERISLKKNSNPSIVEASIEGGANQSSRALILKGLAVGQSTLTITDGVVEKNVTITVKNPDPMTVSKKGGSVLVANNTYQLGDFIIKGGTGNFKVEAIDNADKVNEIAKPEQDILNKSSYNFTIERNINVAEGGVVTIKVTNLDKPSETFTFKVNCETLLKLDFEIAGVSISKTENGNNPYYKISSGYYSGYQLYNINVGQTIDVTISNGTAPFTITGEDSKLEITRPTGNATTFKIKALSSGSYYGDIVIRDSQDKELKITRIYID